ncbi:MAG: hypothetical protein WC854_12560 [Bacteroidales bacterium]
MNIIISHDVDHINSFEHLSDLFLPKYFIRNTLELFAKSISLSEFQKRIWHVLRNKFNNIEALVAFDKEHSVKSTFFIAVNQALNLSYNSNQAKRWTDYILNKGIPVGIHGIAYDTIDGIMEEKERFKELSGNYSFGIRMHYLRMNENTLAYLEQAGYRYDSTVYSLKNPYKIGNLWEFPVNLMDTCAIYGDSNHQIKSLEQIKKETIQSIEKAEELKIQYFTIVTHDFYFSDSHKTWKDWYIWLIDYLQVRTYKFISFENAVRELES